MLPPGQALHKTASATQRDWSRPADRHHAPPVAAFIPLILALLIAQVHRAMEPASGIPLIAAAFTLGGWAVVAELVAQVLRRHGSRLALRRWNLMAQGAILGLFLWLCREAGWANFAPGLSAGLAPWLLMQVALWASLAPAMREVNAAPWTRAGYVLHHLRFELAPILLVLPIVDVCEWIGRISGLMRWFTGEYGLLLSLVGGWLLVLALMGLLPPVIALLWGARRLPDSPLVRRLSEDCAGIGGPAAQLRQWRSPGGTMHNAVAIGLLPGLRWVLVSDDLLRDLPPDQVRAVVGHELGHHRHRHLIAYLWFALASMLGMWLAFDLLIGSADASGRPLFWLAADGPLRQGLIFALPGVDILPGDVVAGLVMAGIVLFCWRILFGVVSRACEREADLCGAEIAGTGSMASALETVARLSGTPDDEPSWRHHPIRERVRFLRALDREPGLALLHHKAVRTMRLAIIAALALLAAMAANLWFDPMRQLGSVSDPGKAVVDWSASDPDLAAALSAADSGDTGPFIAWLGRATASDRQRLARLHLKQVATSGGTGTDGKPLPPDDRAPWRLRHRFAALATVPMQDGTNLDIELDNVYAYGLVAGTAKPTQQDIEQARGKLAGLEAVAARDPQHGLLDTIACVRFSLRDWDAARRAWEAALAALSKDQNLPPADRAAHESLYQRRLEDTRHNLAVAAGSRTSPLRPLHLTFSE